MPKSAKALDNMSKNLTKAERTAREEAEAAVLPERTAVKLKAPAYVRSDKTAAKYWRGILKRMEDISLLDDLDTEILAVYCSMLSRRDTTQALFASLLAEAEGDELDGEARVAILGKMDSLIVKLQGQERSILQYADKLGLTPAGRVSLARKRAAKAAGEVGEDDDLFGD